MHCIWVWERGDGGERMGGDAMGLDVWRGVYVYIYATYASSKIRPEPLENYAQYINQCQPEILAGRFSLISLWGCAAFSFYWMVATIGLCRTVIDITRVFKLKLRNWHEVCWGKLVRL